ncbi:hypothetical protein RRG08_021856 [Elysia crispata]|uniref:Uncharacterized protein n=1 Tax=Elysia crispata TaxID=231223 RepID=A0AAE1CY01_9GAST|nr:hypothetical protein RRG08_021856 [Elysia crispata]
MKVRARPPDLAQTLLSSADQKTSPSLVTELFGQTARQAITACYSHGRYSASSDEVSTERGFHNRTQSFTGKNRGNFVLSLILQTSERPPSKHNTLQVLAA